MAVLNTLKIQGQTSAGVAIATKDVTFHSDGFLRFNDVNSIPRTVMVSGDLAQLLSEIFTGVNGVTATWLK